MHFSYKSAQEYLLKMKRGYSNWIGMNFSVITFINRFFYINDINEDKIKYFEKNLNISLINIRKRLKNN